jgi:hypothetical protein
VGRAAASVRGKRRGIGGSGTVNMSLPTTLSVELATAPSIHWWKSIALSAAKLSRAGAIGLSVPSGAGTGESAFRSRSGSCGKRVRGPGEPTAHAHLREETHILRRRLERAGGLLLGGLTAGERARRLSHFGRCPFGSIPARPGRWRGQLERSRALGARFGKVSPTRVLP